MVRRLALDGGRITSDVVIYEAYIDTLRIYQLLGNLGVTMADRDSLEDAKLNGVCLYDADGVAYDLRGVTYVDRSITSASGSSETLAAANAARRAITIINPLSNTTDWTIDPLGGTAVADTPPGFRLSPGDSWSPVRVPLNKITGIGTAASKLIVLEG
jgi:hypothetical protein